jgi:large subunit ribosomal protein L22
MEVTAISKYVRLSAMKGRDVSKEIQGLPVSQALTILNFTPRKAARLVGKTLKSAIANAEHNYQLDADSLIIKEAVCLMGPAFERMKPMARGSAGVIRKPTTHIKIILTDGNEATNGPDKTKNAKAKANAKVKADAKTAAAPVAAAPAKKAPAKKAAAKKAAAKKAPKKAE